MSPSFFNDFEDIEELPREYAAAVVVDKTVVLVRHFYADSGNAEEIYNKFLEEKIERN